MVNMIIVDDEKLIRTGLASYLDWQALGVCITGTYADGVEALEAIRRTDPEIVLADISMPLMNGIDLLKQARLEGYHAEFIFISAYSEFRFAQDAIKYGAFDYLLKPIEDHALQECVCRCLRHLNIQASRSGNKLELDLVNHLFYGALNDAPGTEASLRSLLDQNGIPQDMLYIAVGMEPSSVLASAQIRALLRPDCIVALYVDQPPPQESAAMYAPIQGTIHQSCCRLLISKWIAEHVLGQQEDNAETFQADWLSKIREAAEDILQSSTPSLSALIAACVNLLRRLQEDMERSSAERIDHQINHGQDGYTLQNVEHAYALLECTYTLGSEMIAAYGAIRALSPYTRKAIALIREQYAQPLSLSLIAEKLRISASHLSVTFKNDTGMTFSDYLFAYRMEKAKTLLAAPDARINEVAQAVGYPDLAQFSKRFKQYYHISPKVMKRRLTAQIESLS